MLAKKPFTFEWSDECTNGTYSNWRSSNVPDVSGVGSICARLDNTQRWRWSALGCNRGGTVNQCTEQHLYYVFYYRTQTKFAKVMFSQVLGLSTGGGLCPGGLCPGGSLSGRPPPFRTVKSWRYASYCNAFLFRKMKNRVTILLPTF